MPFEMIQDNFMIAFPILSLLLLLGGAFVLICICFNLKFFMNHPQVIEMMKEKGLSKTKNFYFNSGILCLFFSFGAFAYWFIVRNPQASSWYKIIVGLVILCFLGKAGKWLMNKAPSDLKK